MLKYALAGFGGLGKVHFKNLLELNKEFKNIKLTSICGVDTNSLTQGAKINIGNTNLENVDFSVYNLYETIDELLENEELDFVICALPTTMHASSSIRFMEKGINVFSEKPMALCYDDCKRMAEASEKNGTLLMIGQCLRFSGAFRKVKEYIDNKTFGEIFRAEFSRYSQLPMWTYKNWILDRKLSGGCPIDMHIHDVDLINAFFGMPKAVSSHATHKRVEFESIFTAYLYDKLLVTSAADWSFPQSFPFTAKAGFHFEKAYVEVCGDEITVYTDEEKFVPETDKEDFFKAELREFITCCIEGKKSSISDCRSVMESVKIAESEILSADKNGEMIYISA